MATTSTRLTVQIDSSTQELLTKAAEISGIPNINSFVLNAAIEKAKKILEHEHALKLSKQDTKALVNALDSSAKPNSKLKKAASVTIRKRTISRFNCTVGNRWTLCKTRFWGMVTN